ncbi:thiamine phosphate synthase [Bacillus norwichensis]|uniref:Thiamine phosphate synthase n=1 Tax=Bacillus norwichensis TaxID=2762217 RepID=A0ABR8VMS3_9BACI|nr:thiamine phosphate synthase [Bacillus norwichensis]MBD8006064.1 thiamine phosphate synthase [Bacillus norwichensis]
MELIAVTNGRYSVDMLSRMMVEVEPFVDHFIIRERTKSAIEYVKLIDQLNTENFNNEKLMINDRVDVAVVAGINKVQLPAHGLRLEQVQSFFPHIQAGRSIHSLEEAVEAHRSGANWLLYGHVYETDCKKGQPARGVEELKKIAEQVPSDIYVIGGIKPRHVEELRNIRIKGIAVMSSIFDHADPARAAEEYRNACRSYHSVERD